MVRVIPRTLSGFMELQPADQMKMERMTDALRDVYSLYGFTPLETPILERSEVLAAKVGTATQKQIYRLQHGDGDIALRFDLTVPLARYVAAHQNDLVFPFRRQAIGLSFRGERAQH